jgi:nitroimidazol reductase NimA-like FMN-containing flavoprotein (pyridoxamine 5'-phosphate oxidase superfamily)
MSDPPTTTATRRALLETLDADEIATILAMKKSATIAFVDAHGFPRLWPCWFYWDGASFYTTSDATKFHVRALERNDRASFCVEHERYVDGRYRGNRQVKGVGRIEIFPDSDGEWLGRILTKYLGVAAPPARLSENRRVVLKLAPARLSAHGGDVDWPRAENVWEQT